MIVINPTWEHLFDTAMCFIVFGNFHFFGNEKWALITFVLFFRVLTTRCSENYPSHHDASMTPLREREGLFSLCHRDSLVKIFRKYINTARLIWILISFAVSDGVLNNLRYHCPYGHLCALCPSPKTEEFTTRPIDFFDPYLWSLAQIRCSPSRDLDEMV